MSIDPKLVALPEGLRPISIPVKDSNLGPRAARPRVKGRFLMGPIPLEWLIRASVLPGKAIHVALAIWFLTGVKKVNTVPLSNKLLREFGVDRFSKSRALKRLSDVGLVAVSQRKGCSPEVTVLECSDEL